MTKPVVGKVMGNIANDNAHSCYTNDRMFEAAIDDLCDGGENTIAIQLISKLRGRNFQMFVIHERIASGDVTEAETAAMTLAASEKGKVGS